MTTATSIIREDAVQIVHDLAGPLDALKGTTLLVTGAGGFLCSHFLETIAVFNETARPGCRVIAVDNFQTGLPERLAWMRDRRDMELRQCDASQPFDPSEPVDWIIHGASIASPPIYRQYPLETIDVNVNGTRHMLDLLRQNGGSGMLLLSSSEIYGDPDPANIPTREVLKSCCPNVPITRELGEYEAPLSNRKAREVLGFKEAHNWRKYVKKG